jgi:pyruvate, orthophosphate dikinase
MYVYIYIFDNTQVQFVQELGLDYTSCSPYRVPIARIAAAQAAIKQQQKQQKQ